MTISGRGKPSGKNEPKTAKDKAAKAEEAARLAEEAAAEAREAARLARLEAEESEETEENEEAGKAAKSLQKPRTRRKGSVDTPEDDNASDEDSESPEPASARADGTAAESAWSGRRPRPAVGPSRRSAWSGRRPRAASLSTVIAVLVVLAIAFGTGTTVLALKVREQNAAETAGKEASFAASRAAQKLSSYDYQTLDADLSSASATTTGKLRADYDKLALQLRTVAAQQRAVSTTTVMKVGVVSATPDKVVALVYANRSSATKDDKQQRLPEPLRIKMTMVKKDGEWLASSLTVIS